MPCFSPLKGFQSKKKSLNGKYTLVFNPKLGFVDKPMQVSCGQCVGCRLERSRQWAIRCVHEAHLYDLNSFITLTYDDRHLPENGNLNPEHFTLFMKRLRQYAFRKHNTKIRFYMCGEYGSLNNRPHFHAILFNFDFPDKKFLKKSPNGELLFTSEILSNLWENKGFVTVGSVTFDSAAYVARYIMKKVNGREQESHYYRMNSDTGEYYHAMPEYNRMSRMPGIGSGFYAKYKDGIYPEDEVIINNVKLKPPKYYDRLYEIENPDEYEKLKRFRRFEAEKNALDNTPERLLVRREVFLAKASKLVRNLQ